MKKCVASILACMIFMSSFCYAVPTLKKNETVYINLNSSGDVEKINIYSKCMINKEEKIIDSTKYKSIENLTNKENYEVSGEDIVWNVSGEEKFSYTGEVNSEYYNLLPWKFNITYKLNGVEISMESLLGASGLVEICIEINANEMSNEYYKNNYILEITGNYDMSEYLSINSDEAMITDTGNNKTLMFIALPGQSTTLHIEIGTDEFEMDGITMAMVPLTGDILKSISDIVKEKDDTENALTSIDKSADIILNSLSGMNTGLNGISIGVKEIKNGTKEIHGLNNARDTDIENLKSILNDMLPIIEEAQVDIDSMVLTYQTFIELSENLNKEMKEMQEEVESLNINLEETQKIINDLPDDVEDINSTIDTIAKLCGSLSTVMDSVSDSQDIDTNTLEESLIQIGKDAKEIGTTVQTVYPTVADPALASSLLKIGNAANNVGTNLQKVNATLEEMNNISTSAISGDSGVAKGLRELKTKLYKMSDMLDESDAETLRDTVSDFRKISETLENMLETVTEYNDKLLLDKDNFIKSMENIKKMTEELKQMSTLSLSTINNTQNTLKILDNDIYSGAEKTSDAIITVNNQLLKITKESNQFKDSKNQIKNIVENKWNDIENKTNIFNVDENAKVVSFGSEKNENIDKVQFFIKTPDVKSVKAEINDFEKKEENTTFWDRVRVVLNKMFGWIIEMFM